MQKDSLATNAILWSIFKNYFVLLVSILKNYFVLLICRSVIQDIEIEKALDIIYSVILIFTHGKIGAPKGLICWKSL